ncbi:hypothetical protein L9F63_004983 [Diploptera punctata]|uniref:SKA complex subunit 1 n=1 Tax=Diploptera punctata TaxID=6984 RepID=A0AAD7ZEB0_DIPPU|nr:hypothetical protein L9F63_004983 [Diploptera punctata]
MEVSTKIDQLVKKVDLLLECENILEGYNETSDIPVLKIKMKEQICVIQQKLLELGNVELVNKINYMKKLICHLDNNLPERYHFKTYDTESATQTKISEEEEAAAGDSAFCRKHLQWDDLSPDNDEVMGRLKRTSRSYIEYFTLEQFDKVPGYLRGRLNREKVNQFIDGFNEALKKKYEIFGQPRESLRGKVLITYDAFKKQETRETIEKGIYFCTAEDLKIYGNIKMDKISQNMLNILRNAQRIREIRTPGIIRYAVSS